MSAGKAQPQRQQHWNKDEANQSGNTNRNGEAKGKMQKKKPKLKK